MLIHAVGWFVFWNIIFNSIKLKIMYLSLTGQLKIRKFTSTNTHLSVFA